MPDREFMLRHRRDLLLALGSVNTPASRVHRIEEFYGRRSSLRLSPMRYDARTRESTSILRDNKFFELSVLDRRAAEWLSESLNVSAASRAHESRSITRAVSSSSAPNEPAGRFIDRPGCASASREKPARGSIPIQFQLKQFEKNKFLLFHCAVSEREDEEASIRGPADRASADLR
jgi:hypothetical protein